MSVSPDDKIRILDLATGFVQFRFSRNEIARDVYSRSFLKILSARSTLGGAPADLYPVEEPSRPDAGHGSTRISMAAGVHRGEKFAELNIRPEFHALLDPDQGYLPGAQIKFFDAAIRYAEGYERLHLKSLHIIDIISIAPRDTFFKPLSWKINTGFDRELLRDGEEHLIYRLNSGGGFSYSSPFGGIWYLLGELDVNAGPEFRDFVAVAPGFSLGAAEQLSRNSKILLTMSAYWYGVGDDRSIVKVSAGMNQRITQNNSLSLEASHEYMNGLPLSEVALRWNYYY